VEGIMGVGKYSPTVHDHYQKDQKWFEKNCVNVGDIYDRDGFDSYGYNAEGFDRDGHDERFYVEEALREELGEDYDS
jgi:hypothetical protein